MRGEQLREAFLDPEGIRGDRRYAFVSSAAPSGKPLLRSTERTAMLLYASRVEASTLVESPHEATLPLLSPELLRQLQSSVAAPGAQLELRHSPDDPLTDVRPVSLISAATVSGIGEELKEKIDGQRFRSNIVLDLAEASPFGEDKLTGATLCFGEGMEAPQLRVLERIPRCRIVSLNPKTAEAHPLLLGHLARHHGGRVGIYARVLRPGLVLVGDEVNQIS